jgi:predicted Zn-dependent peptidase
MFHLSNGMQVVWIPDRRAPVVTHMLWYRVGSADETPGKSGLAHFFEHLMFKGTTNYPEDAYARLIGRVGGELNAFTSHDYTAYFATVGTDSLELVMALEADRKENLIIGAAGAISGAELTEALDRVFGELPERGMRSAAPAAVFVPSDPLVVRLSFPQSSCMFGHMGVRPTSPDYIPAIVLNHIVGGGILTSRLFIELREKRGLVYSVRTTLEPLSDETLMIGWFATENDKIPTAIELVRREWQRLANGDVSEADIDEAKAFLKGTLPLALDGTSRIVRRLLAVQRLGLDIDHLTAWNAKIDVVTVEMVRALARRLMRLDVLTFAIAGDPTGL